MALSHICHPKEIKSNAAKESALRESHLKTRRPGSQTGSVFSWKHPLALFERNSSARLSISKLYHIQYSNCNYTVIVCNPGLSASPGTFSQSSGSYSQETSARQLHLFVLISRPSSHFLGKLRPTLVT